MTNPSATQRSRSVTRDEPRPASRSRSSTRQQEHPPAKHSQDEKQASMIQPSPPKEKLAMTTPTPRNGRAHKHRLTPEIMPLQVSAVVAESITSRPSTSRRASRKHTSRAVTGKSEEHQVEFATERSRPKSASTKSSKDTHTSRSASGKSAEPQVEVITARSRPKSGSYKYDGASEKKIEPASVGFGSSSPNPRLAQKGKVNDDTTSILSKKSGSHKSRKNLMNETQIAFATPEATRSTLPPSFSRANSLSTSREKESEGVNRLVNRRQSHRRCCSHSFEDGEHDVVVEKIPVRSLSLNTILSLIASLSNQAQEKWAEERKKLTERQDVSTNRRLEHAKKKARAYDMIDGAIIPQPEEPNTMDIAELRVERVHLLGEFQGLVLELDQQKNESSKKIDSLQSKLSIAETKQAELEQKNSSLANTLAEIEDEKEKTEKLRKVIRKKVAKKEEKGTGDSGNKLAELQEEYDGVKKQMEQERAEFVRVLLMKTREIEELKHKLESSSSE